MAPTPAAAQSIRRRHMRHTSLDPGLGSEGKGGKFYALFLHCCNCVEGTSIFKVKRAKRAGITVLTAQRISSG